MACTIQIHFSLQRSTKVGTLTFLCAGSYTIQGRRVCVYQPELEECWALGLVSQHDLISHIMEIMLDKVMILADS